LRALSGRNAETWALALRRTVEVTLRCVRGKRRIWRAAILSRAPRNDGARDGIPSQCPVYGQTSTQSSVAPPPTNVTVVRPDGISVPELGVHAMRLSPSFRLSPSLVVPSAIAALSTVLLVGPAASQIPSGSAATLPSVTVDAPKQVARPSRPERAANTGGSRRTSARTASSATRTPSYAPGSVMGRIASLEARASSCNGGCASSFPSGKDPWVGCSESGGGTNYGPFSPTCRDTITHTSYEGCVETKVFLGENRNKAHWFCSSLQAGNRFKVAELKRSGRR